MSIKIKTQTLADEVREEDKHVSTRTGDAIITISENEEEEEEVIDYSHLIKVRANKE